MALRLDYVAGVSPAKWLRAWADRRPDLPLEAERVEESAQCDRLRAGEADLAFVRLPVDETGLHRILLWEELAVAALPKDHPLAEADDLELADLADEPRAPEQDDPAMTLELVAAGTGYAILPHSLARLHHRRDVVAIPVTDAAPTRIALVWRVERDDADIQEFVGVVRGRTARSSRGADEPDETAAPPAKPAAASRDRRQPAGGRRSGGRSGGTGRGGRQQRRGGRRR
ncbi:Hca operon transcriptional activator HcaR [Agromyces sp. NDB4Y10]|uniref:LysR family substrate-binding domain-containing protein n=1 Tax=Agromyces sp. NDB4Y10 TaxID=1775951 RepID=UPI0007B1D54A|nr:LysR family substrate-binding domain-containing protein [Agromyces sp. NDB4Y10]KZE94608.1 Hca operon transcriptional activator HcaR [Agromyces sp. NDB4Y10]